MESDALVFPTREGQHLSVGNFRNRVLAPATKRANEKLAAAGLPPLPDKLTPRSLRRTFASLLYALGEPPPVVMAEMGHTTRRWRYTSMPKRCAVGRTSGRRCGRSWKATNWHSLAFEARRLMRRQTSERQPERKAAYYRLFPMGDPGLEPGTSSLSEKRSDRLS